MSNRPSLARKVTPKSEKNRADALSQGVRISVDGESYEIRMGDVTPALARELRRTVGKSFNALMDEMGRDPDIDSISEFVWLARRLKGDVVALDDVEVDYRAMLDDGFEIDVAGAEEVDDSPEA